MLGPKEGVEGDLFTYQARNKTKLKSIEKKELIYTWSVSPKTKITENKGDSLTIDTTGQKKQNLTAFLEVSDKKYGKFCRQRLSLVSQIKEPPYITNHDNYPIIEFPTRNNDEDKARLDHLAIELQNNPKSTGLIVLYQGTDNASKIRTVGRVSQMAYNYLVNKRGIDPKSVSFMQSENPRTTTTYQIYLLRPGSPFPFQVKNKQQN